MKKNIFFILILLLSTNLFANQYSYVKEVNADRLKYEIQESTITIALDYIQVSGSTVTIVFKVDLSSDEKTLLDTIVTNHSPEPIEPDPLPVQVSLGVGAGDRLKWKGYKFTAYPSTTTYFDFTMPFDGNLQGGIFYAGQSDTGDMIEFTLLPDTDYEFKYVETLYLEQGANYEIVENFAVSDTIPYGTPMCVSYYNVGTTTKTVTFNLIYRKK